MAERRQKGERRPERGAHSGAQCPAYAWPPGQRVIGPAPGVEFDFNGLFLDAVKREEAAGGDGFARETDIAPASTPSPHAPPGPETMAPSLPLPPHFLPMAGSAPRNPILPSKRGSIEKQIRKNRGKVKRAMKRYEEKLAAGHGDYVVKPSVINQHVRPANGMRSSANASAFPHTKNAYTGGRVSGGKKVWRLDELVGEDSKHKFKLEKWDGRTAVPIIDAHERVIAVLTGAPAGSNLNNAQLSAADAIEEARKNMRIPKGGTHHRRGAFYAEAVGATMGKGSKVPSLLSHGVVNTAIMASLLSNTSVIRFAGLASGEHCPVFMTVRANSSASIAAFAAWGPNLYQYYVDHLRPFYAHHPHIKRNFVNSIFACATFNFGPVSCCFDHTDVCNLPFGWCSITSLGRFDPARGGHLVLWDLRLVIEFPPGATVLIPSAILRHSNTALQQGETRYSFTQYTAGGIFRWVDHGFKLTADYLKGLSKEEQEAYQQRSEERWGMGVNLFSTLTSLQQPPNLDSVE